MPRRIGIIGYGNMGRYLVDYILQHFQLELSFVWCPNPSALASHIESKCFLKDLGEFHTRSPDLIIDLSLPEIAKKYGALFLQKSDYMIAYPSCLLYPEIEKSLKSAAIDHGIYIPVGMLWDVEGIMRMADQGTLHSLKIIITKQPSNFSLLGDLKTKNDKVKTEAVVLFHGNIRDLYPQAPLDIYPMIVAATAAHTLGYEKVETELISDPNLQDEIVVKLEVVNQDVQTQRMLRSSSVIMRPVLPIKIKVDVAQRSLLNSMLKAGGKGGGLHLC